MLALSEPILLTSDQCVKYKNRLAAFYYSNIKACYCMDKTSYEDAEQKIASMIEHVSKGAAWVWGVFEKEKLVGYLWAYEHSFREEARVYVNEIHVEESYRNRGVGRQLLSAVESMAKSRGYGALYLHAEGNNEGAVSLYRSQGYEIERVQFRKGL